LVGITHGKVLGIFVLFFFAMSETTHDYTDLEVQVKTTNSAGTPCCRKVDPSRVCMFLCLMIMGGGFIATMWFFGGYITGGK